MLAARAPSRNLRKLPFIIASTRQPGDTHELISIVRKNKEKVRK